MLTLVLGLAVVSLVAYRAVSGRQSAGGGEASTPKQTLDNVRTSARNIEAEQARQAKEAMEKATPKE
jgi:hypothetical protein